MRDITLYNVSQEFEYIADLLDRDVLEQEEKERLQTMLAEKIKESSREIITYQIDEQAKIEAF